MQASINLYFDNQTGWTARLISQDQYCTKVELFKDGASQGQATLSNGAFDVLKEPLMPVQLSLLEVAA